MVEPVHIFEGGILDLIPLCHGPVGRKSSVLYRPITDSARALSYESPTNPTDGVMPASASRLV